MKNIVTKLYAVWLLLSLSVYVSASDEYTLTQISYTQGLSNSAVLSVFQDNHGFMWFGTYDGLNQYDGKRMEVFRTDMAVEKPLINNSIYGINAAGDDCLWISTQVGINRFSVRKRAVVGTYENFKDDARVVSNREGDTWILEKNSIYCYDTNLSEFVRVDKWEKKHEKELSFVDSKGYLWLFSTDNSIYRCRMKPDNDFTIIRANIHQKKIIYTFYQNGILAFIDKDKDLFMFDVIRNTKLYVRNVGELIKQYGKIQGIVSFCNDIVIAFLQNGLVRLDAASRYSENVIDSKFRIFSIYKDPVQDIVWIGTDGQGVMAYSKKPRLATHIMFNQLQNKIVRQVRSIYTDDKGDLWFGTKGDGLVRVKDFAINANSPDLVNATSVYFPGTKRSLLGYRRGLLEFQVFGIIPSRYMNGFWLGSAENPALSFYDYDRDAIIPLEQDSILSKVHRVYEENDSTLWVTTSGRGLCKVIIDRSGSKIVAQHIRQFIFKDGQREINDFFPMSVEGDSVMWLGSRGMGLVRFNYHTEAYKVYLLENKEKFSINDILAIYPKEDHLYLGTVSGLVKLKFAEDGSPVVFSIGKEQGFLNDMIHGILGDRNGFLWLSTNKGLVKYNPTDHAFHTYYYTNGLQIGEFSDDAFYKSSPEGSLFFGGIDGLLWLEKGGAMNETDHLPQVCFYDMELEGETVNFYDYYDEATQTLALQGVNLALSLSFIAPDFIEGDNFEYSYCLDDKEWSSFSSTNTARLKSLAFGDHELKVKYKRDAFDSECQFYSLKIHVQPPWYLSMYAFIVYLLVFTVGGIYAARFLRRHVQQKKLIKELMLHESHNAALGSISGQFHETTGSFAAIYKMCSELREFKSMPEEYYAKLDVIHETVLSFAFKADGALQEPLDLGDYFPKKLPIYGEVNIKKVSDEVIGILIHQGFNNVSDLNPVFASEQNFYLPDDALKFLLYNLYVEVLRAKTNVAVRLEGRSDSLLIQLKLPEDICEKLIELSEEVLVASNMPDFDTYLRSWLFVYVMKGLNASVKREGDEVCVLIPIEKEHHEQTISPDEADKELKTVLLLEDRVEIIWMVKNILAEGYRVVVVTTIQAAFAHLRKNIPDLFLADTLMYLSKEKKFIDYIQANRGLLSKTVFIPMLTWKAAHLLAKQLDNLIAGFIVMPYNILFLKEIVNMALQRASNKQIALAELFKGADEEPSNNVANDNFMKDLREVIDANLDKEDLGSSFLAEQMFMSPRQFYRKFKEINGTSPSEYIKAYRIDKAARLLQETDMPIANVIAEVGIASRSYFYKEFYCRFGVKPKEYRDMKKK